MKCTFCNGEETQVLESRVVDDGKSIRRRRECEDCKKRFTTYEKPRAITLWVIKKDGRREPFDREKLRRGILRAIEKRPVSLDTVDSVVAQVEHEMTMLDRQEVSSRQVGEEVVRRLSSIDKVAWLRFASVYLEFDDLDDFKGAISNLNGKYDTKTS